MICNECGKKTDVYYNLNVIDEKKGTTSFMLNYDAKCWAFKVIDWCAQSAAMDSRLEVALNDALNFYKNKIKTGVSGE